MILLILYQNCEKTNVTLTVRCCQYPFWSLLQSWSPAMITPQDYRFKSSDNMIQTGNQKLFKTYFPRAQTAEWRNRCTELEGMIERNSYLRRLLSAEKKKFCFEIVLALIIARTQQPNSTPDIGEGCVSWALAHCESELHIMMKFRIPRLREENCEVLEPRKNTGQTCWTWEWSSRHGSPISFSLSSCTSGMLSSVSLQ